jgi:hypothetical protein
VRGREDGRREEGGQEGEKEGGGRGRRYLYLRYLSFELRQDIPLF